MPLFAATQHINIEAFRYTPFRHILMLMPSLATAGQHGHEDLLFQQESPARHAEFRVGWPRRCKAFGTSAAAASPVLPHAIA